MGRRRTWSRFRSCNSWGHAPLGRVVDRAWPCATRRGRGRWRGGGWGGGGGGGGRRRAFLQLARAIGLAACASRGRLREPPVLMGRAAGGPATALPVRR